MISDERQLRVSLQQMQRIIDAIQASKDEVLPKNPPLYATLAEGYVEELMRIKEEINEHLTSLEKSIG